MSYGARRSTPWHLSPSAADIGFDLHWAKALPHPRLRLTPDLLWIVGILALSTAIGLAWMFSIPFQQAPDEAAHFQVVRFIRDFGRLPRFEPGELWLLKT